MPDRGGESGAPEAEGALREADRTAHDARNALNTVSLTLQLLERIVGKTEMPAEARDRILARVAAAAPEVDKVRGALEELRLLARRAEGRG